MTRLWLRRWPAALSERARPRARLSSILQGSATPRRSKSGFPPSSVQTGAAASGGSKTSARSLSSIIGPGARARDLTETALAFKQDWARRSGRIATALADPRFGRFLIDAAGGGAHAPDLRVFAMFCAGEPIGVELSVACKGRVFGHVLASKPGFEKQGAGAILAGRSIADALEQGFCGYDLLAPADPYKMEWASGCVGVSDFALARTWAGRLYKWAWLDFGREALRSLAKRLAPRLRRAANRPV